MVQENNYNRIQALRTVGSGVNVGEYAIGDATPEECLELLLENDDVNVITDDQFDLLEAIDLLTPANNDFFQYKSGAWVNRTVAQVKIDLAIDNLNNTSDANKPISTATQNALNLKADLVAGKVPASQLPSYVDDVEEYADLASFPVTGESGKLYIDLSITPYPTYRWTGSMYAPVGNTLALGETSTTAYRGDRGKIAYDHSQLTHDKAFVGLPNVDNTSDLNKPVSTAQQTALNLKADLSGASFSGNVGITTSNLYSKLFVGNGELFVDYANGGGTNGGAMRIGTNANGAFIAGNQYNDGSGKYTRAGGSAGIQFRIANDANAGDITFFTSPAGVADGALTQNNRLIIKENGVVDLLMGQIKFPATQNPSADANTLDDYEEGEATVSILCGTSGTVTLNTSFDKLRYTKIGGNCVLNGYLQPSAISSPLGDFFNINGLPFSARSGVSSRSSVSIVFRNNSTGVSTAVHGWIQEGTNTIHVRKTGVVLDICGDFTTDVHVYINASYPV